MNVHEYRTLALILIVFLAIAGTYSVVTPIFEAGDEIWHYPYVQHLATGHSLPIQDSAVKTLWAQEGGQPPLYYALAALATFWIDTRDLPDRLWYNPHAKIGIPLLYGNKNMIVHTSAESFPWHNTALAVHLIRVLSILFSTATVTLTYFLALEIKPDKSLAAASAAFVAFNPMFIFISASVNNDSLAAMLAALSLLLLARLLTSGPTIKRFALLGVVLGLAAIAKVSDLGLIMVAALVFLVSLRQALSESEGRRSNSRRVSVSRSPLVGIVLSGILVVAIAGWWYVRNYLLYNDPFAFNVWIAIAGGRPTSATIATLLGEFQGLRISFWGNFGGVNIIAPEWVYTVLDTMTLLAMIGLLIGLARRVLPRLLALPGFWYALIFIALIRWTMLTLASQGRLLFPAISAVAILFTFGLAQLTSYLPFTRRAIGNWLLVVPLSFLFAFSLLTPFLLIAPTYALPKRLSADASVPNPVRIVFEDQAELVGYDLPQKSVAPNSELPITLYWRALTPMYENFSVYIHVFDGSGKQIGQWDAYPGNGLYPTRLWILPRAFSFVQPSPPPPRPEIIVDNYRVPIAPDAMGPSVGRVEVGLYRKESLSTLIARDPQGHDVTPVIARFKISGQANVRVENPVRYDFADKIALVGWASDESVAAGSTLRVHLYWRALRAMDEDYTVFVHLVDAGGKLIAQKDDQPQHGAYPTSFWDVGESIADEYIIEIPPDTPVGDYRLQIGLYRASDNSRLPVGTTDHLDLITIHVSH